MPDRNQHGLSRTIPAATRREVRQRCGFGCVICGLGFYDYEHFDPEFKDARAHDSRGITLLCMQCNQKKQRGLLSVDSVRDANSNPKCLESGFANEWFDFGRNPLEVRLGGVSFRNCQTLLEIDDCPILRIAEPETEHGPYRLSGLFADETGATTLRIDENRWIAGADNWDVEWSGPMLTIRGGPREIVLSLRAEPPTGLSVSRLNMAYDGLFLRGNEEMLESSFDGRNWSTWVGVSMDGCRVGIAFRMAA